MSAWTKRKRPTCSDDSDRTEAAIAPSTRSSSPASSIASAAERSRRSNSRPITAAILSASSDSPPRRSMRRSITSRTLSGSAMPADLSTLHREVSSSNTMAPDSERPRRISPTKNGLPSVSAAIWAASCSASVSSSCAAIAVMNSATSSGPRPCRAIRCTPCRGRRSASTATSGWSLPRSESRNVAISCSDPCSWVRSTCLSSASDCASAQCRSSSTTHSGTVSATSANSPATALNSR